MQRQKQKRPLRKMQKQNLDNSSRLIEDLGYHHIDIQIHSVRNLDAKQASIRVHELKNNSRRCIMRDCDRVWMRTAVRKESHVLRHIPEQAVP